MSHKRDRSIAQLRQLAKDKGLTFRQEVWRGKGGHAMIWVGDDDLGGRQGHHASVARDRSQDRKENLESTRSGRSVAGSYAFPWKDTP
jgi:hypothetical protein